MGFNWNSHGFCQNCFCNTQYSLTKVNKAYSRLLGNWTSLNTTLPQTKAYISNIIYCLEPKPKKRDNSLRRELRNLGYLFKPKLRLKKQKSFTRRLGQATSYWNRMMLGMQSIAAIQQLDLSKYLTLKLRQNVNVLLEFIIMRALKTMKSQKCTSSE